MAVHIISRKALYQYIETNSRYRTSLEAWAALTETQTWQSPLDIVESFGRKATDILGKKDNKVTTVSPQRAVVDVRGNDLRIIFKYQFHPSLKTSRIYIKWIGTHAEYDKLCAQNKQYEVDYFKS